jgi:hypothetical protein
LGFLLLAREVLRIVKERCSRPKDEHPKAEAASSADAEAPCVMEALLIHNQKGTLNISHRQLDRGPDA